MISFSVFLNKVELLRTTKNLKPEQIESLCLRSLSAKHVSEKRDAARSERARRRRVTNPVWENILSESREAGREGGTNKTIDQLTRARLDQEKIRMKNYKLEMEEMMRRVENQPTLFQKQSQVWRLHRLYCCCCWRLLWWCWWCWWLVSKTNLINCF